MWMNPFYVLSSLMAWLNRNITYQNNSGVPIGMNPLQVGMYLLVSVVAIAAALCFMVSRYGRAVRERT
jgi:polyferredoxin